MRLAEFYPRFHRRYSSLPILGPTAESFATWLSQNGYPRLRVRIHVRKTRSIDRALQRRGCTRLDEVTRHDLRACMLASTGEDVNLTAAFRTLERFLDEQGLLPPPEAPTRTEALVRRYACYLEEVRGFVATTVAAHVRTASELLENLRYEARPSHLTQLKVSDLDAFVRLTGERVGRETLQHEVAHIRGFLRFLATEGLTPPGLDSQLDTPRVYRLERLPRALPWKTVQAFLRAIDRRTPLGRRDYAMFLLIATYGLRASELVDLTLDDIDWRAGRLRVPQRKTETPLLLPLTESVGNALVGYLRRGRPSLACREIFLRARAPAGVLKPTAVTEAFQTWSKRSGLNIPFQGPHCLRHSYAVHLLRIGISLKTIGDVLGHRSAESTCVYLRLAVEDLRDVALSLPQDLSCDRNEEGCT